jgi:hypothetical protein
MSFIAVLMVGESLPGEQPPGLGIVGGIALVERQVRMALKAGAEAVWLMASALPAELAARLAAEPACWRVSDAAQLGEKLAGDARDALLMAPGLLADERLIAAVASDERSPLLLAFGGEAPGGAERLDSASHWAGIARLPAELVAEVAGRWFGRRWRPVLRERWWRISPCMRRIGGGMCR